MKSVTTSIRNTATKVKALLNMSIEARDNDGYLVTNMWYKEMKEMGIDAYKIDATDFFKLYCQGKVTSADVITRARRKVQEECPELRGKNWEERHKESENVRKIENYYL